MSQKRGLLRLIAALALFVSLSIPTIARAQATPASTGGVPSYQHIFVVMLENHNYDQIIGNSVAIHINALAQTYGLATNYYGVTHPSEPNYVATIGGDYFGIQDDEPFSATANGVNHTIDGPSLASQLEAAGLTWKSYQQSLPYPGYLGTTYPSSIDALYASKHNPFLNFASVQNSPAELQKIVPDTQLYADLQSGDVPNLSYIVPDLCHDMHGGAPACPYANNPGDANDNYLVRLGDEYVNVLYNAITNSRIWSQGNNAIVVVWDENDVDTSPVTGCCDANPGGGRVAAIVITNHGPRGIQDSTPYNHYSLLQTVQDAFGVGCLRNTCDTTHVTPMTPLFALGGSGPGTTTTPELGSGELLATGIVPLMAVLVYRRRTHRRAPRRRGHDTVA